jgi:hypothetical protein
MRRDNTIEAPTACLFQCRNDAGLFAVSLQRSAGNTPLSTTWYAGWRLRGEFMLGLDELTPTATDPKPILRGVRSVGYYIWRNGLV